MIMKNSTRYNGKLNILGNIIKQYRESNDLTLMELSNKLLLIGIDIPKNSLQRLEQGKRIIKDYELAGFSKVFNVSIDTLLSNFVKELE